MAHSSISSNTNNSADGIREFDLVGEAAKDHQPSEDTVTIDGEEDSMPLVAKEEDKSEENNEESEEIPMEEGRSDGDGDSKGVLEVEPVEQHENSEDTDDGEDEDEDEEESLSPIVGE
ncbi:hypothetical protein FXO38_25071 [Capsicum annuum]|nr:hypothetical protein FXO38_25071 [Capsicum annuum]KAF3637139.1 hypothetical protein FXO37_25078 [Capsicum annuum]